MQRTAGGRRTSGCPRCDPHPVRRPGAAARRRPSRGTLQLVAILTRSGDRVQRDHVEGFNSQGGALRSSPGPETGCSDLAGRGRRARQHVAILTRSGDRVQHALAAIDPELVGSVAILTRSGDRVQLEHHRLVVAGVAVAILTRSGDRVQLRRCRRRTSTGRCCDPHPVRRPGAACLPSCVQLADRKLRSSPGPETGCSAPQAVRGAPVRQGCDPHPVRRPGAAAAEVVPRIAVIELRSSPGPETGCSTSNSVSVTRCRALRSSPGPETGCSWSPWSSARRSTRLRSSPGPETGCSVIRTTRSTLPLRRLRSSPGPETGCSSRPDLARRERARVAILTRSGDRVQHVRAASAPCSAASCDPHPVRRPGAAT